MQVVSAMGNRRSDSVCSLTNRFGNKLFFDFRELEVFDFRELEATTQKLPQLFDTTKKPSPFYEM